MGRKQSRCPDLKVKRENGEYVISINTPVVFRLPATKVAKKMLMILLCLFVNEKGKSLLTYRQIAGLLGYPDRRNVNNYWREFDSCGRDMLAFLTRKVDYAGLKTQIEEFVLQRLSLPLSEIHRLFQQEYSIKMCSQTFYKYLSQIDALIIIKLFQKLLREISCAGESIHILRLLSDQHNVPILCENLAEQAKEPFPKSKSYINLCLGEIERSLFVNYLVGSGMNLKTIALLLNTCKSNVSRLLHNISDLQSMILNSIKFWSGKISIDEKYLKINGIPHYAITIVDFVTGLPLFSDIYPNTTKEAYEACFRTFHLIYKKIPTLIVSDGSTALAAARKSVFPQVHHQLCKFHKIRNLFKAINKLSISDSEKYKLKRIVFRAFRRKNSNDRKKGLLSKCFFNHQPVSEYINNNIIKNWRHLSKNLTSNVSERFNRKIKKVMSGRYGLKSLETTRALLFSLWLKDLIENGKPTLNQNSTIANLNISKLCQENVDWSHISHFFKLNTDKAA